MMVENNDLAVSVLSALPHPVFVVGADGCFAFANSAAEVFFRSSFNVMRKRQFSWYLLENTPMTNLIEQVRVSGTPVSEYRVDVSSPRLGEENWVDVYVGPVAEDPESVIVMLQVKSMAETMDRQLTHRGAARTVTGLAAMLAHEIKNPLAGIRGAAQLLETHSDEDDRALTKLITDETDRIVRLVDRMEVFSDERPIERDPVNIHSVLEHVKILAANSFAKSVSFHELYDPSLPPVMGNRDQLIQIVLNLIKNACEAMVGKDDAKLSITTAFRPGMRIAAAGSKQRVSLPISLTIQDNGSGVPEDMRAYMFDPFVTTKQNGSGLGLALVAKIVGDHGGIVSCESSSKGTTFEILLPMWKMQDDEKGAQNA
jgi:two-component system nitrogen regulation sensor histidine kinase GlnL